MKKRVLHSWAVFCLLVAATVALQIAVRAYETEAGNYPDEAAHFLNGVLLRDYLTHGLGQAPFHFAENYYLHYPKIAPVMWPPLFHIAEGLFLLPGWPPHTAALALLALITAWAAWRLYRIVLMFAPPLAALITSGLYLFTPVILELSSAVMVDVVVAAIALEATYWLAMYFASEKTRHAVLFGLFAVLSCLTKGNGIAVVLLPVFLILFTGRFDLLRKRGLYIAAAMVMALALPVVVISYRLDAGIGDFGPVTGATVFRRLGFYGSFLKGQVGAFALAMASIGLLQAVRTGWRRETSVPAAQGLAALACSALLFHAANPHQEIDGRYMTLAVAPLLGLLTHSILAAGMLASRARYAIHGALSGAVLLSLMTAPTTFAGRQPLGFSEAMRFLESCDELAGQRILVVSDANGEGAFVSEVATRQPNPAATVVRGTKLLARINWPGDRQELLFASSGAILNELEDLHVSYLVLDNSPESAGFAFWPQVDEMIRQNPGRFVSIYSTDESAEDSMRSIVVYELVRHAPGPPKPLRIDLSATLGRVLEE